jgi:hypothetical protein
MLAAKGRAQIKSDTLFPGHLGMTDLRHELAGEMCSCCPVNTYQTLPFQLSVSSLLVYFIDLNNNTFLSHIAYKCTDLSISFQKLLNCMSPLIPVSHPGRYK